MRYATAWQNKEHSQQFGKAIRKKNLLVFISKYNRYIPARCLNYLVNSSTAVKLSILDVGCAAGDIYAYLYGVGASCEWEYKGLDISEPAINIAKKHYGSNLFSLIEKNDKLTDKNADIVVSIDVLIHHLNPYEHLAALINCTTKYLLLGLRTRESGETVLNPDYSCQRNYGEWVPFFVFNSKELYKRIFETSDKPVNIICFKEYQILAGQSRRFLPKELYSTEPKTAVTTLLIEKSDTKAGGQVCEYIIDKTKGNFKKPFGFDFLSFLYSKKLFDSFILDKYTERIKKIEEVLKYSETIDTKVLNFKKN